MKRWLGLFAILAVAAVAILGYLRWQAGSPASEKRFMRIQHGMHLDQARAIMGRREDTWKGKEYRTWLDDSSENTFTVEINEDGRVLGKSLYRPKHSGLPDYHD